jgi:putative transposase
MKAYPVTVLCAVMRVSRSGFYDYLERYSPGGDHRPAEAGLRRRIKEIFDQSRSSYGSRRIVKQLNKEGCTIGRYKVRRIMCEMGLKAKTPKRFKLTTNSRHSFAVAPNVLDRNFDVDVANKVWTADISYVWTFEGWLYLAIVMDLYSRQIIGWAMDKRMNHEYRNCLDAYGMIPSMSRKGDCWDNAPTERFFRSLKSERLSDFIFTTRKAAKAQVIDYIGYYNGIRLHSTLGYQPPVVYEKELYRNAA